MTPILTIAQINELLIREFPQMGTPGTILDIVNIASGTATLRFHPGVEHLRPGGTISGPSLFLLADVAAYVAILAHVGPVVGAVTVNHSISFLHRPEPVPVDGIARILKLGKRLAFLEVAIERTDNREMVAHATTTFSIPSPK